MAIQHRIHHRSHSRARPRLCVDSDGAAIWLHYAVWGSCGEGTIHIHVFTFSDGGCFHTQFPHSLSHTARSGCRSLALQCSGRFKPFLLELAFTTATASRCAVNVFPLTSLVLHELCRPCTYVKGEAHSYFRITSVASVLCDEPDHACSKG